jgi:hypothetical protein
MAVARSVRGKSLSTGAADSTRVDWIDVNDGAAPLTCDLDRSQALARMHARRADGTLVSGAAAFGVIWRETPGFRWLGRLVAIPPVGLAAEFAYRLFLRVRPLWR